MLQLARLFGEGCVLQQGRPVAVFGTEAPGAKITVSLQGHTAAATADRQGAWQVELPALQAGGPYRMQIEDDGGAQLTRSVYVGEVWLCAGQSNMELPMQRVRDRFPAEMTRPEEPRLRMFKITEHYVFDAPLTEPETGSWLAASPETLPNFSATAYFFGKALLAARGVPVGLIDTSKGGSRIEAWMPRTALQDYAPLLAEADKYKGAGAVAAFDAREQAVNAAWHGELAAAEQTPDETGWTDITLPGFFAQRDARLQNFCGSILLRRVFTVPDALLAANAEKPVKLWYGTIVDSDKTYVNGVFVGETGYQYPPRKYDIPAGTLHAGKNELTIRLVCDAGVGRLTPGKEHVLFSDDCTERVDLDGVWQYRILHRSAPAPAMDFICRKATGAWNGMVAPCTRYAVCGVLWYQGESNDFRPGDYEDLLRKMMTSWRAAFGRQLPFVIVQLPNFEIDLGKLGEGWPLIREAQRRAAQQPGAALCVTLGLGEDNDLHPLNKEAVGRRAAAAAEYLAYGGAACAGPAPLGCRAEGNAMLVEFDKPLHTAENAEAEEFELAGPDGKFYPAKAVLCGSNARLTAPEVSDPCAVRYAWRNAPCKGLLCNAEGTPTSPFRLTRQG